MTTPVGPEKYYDTRTVHVAAFLLSIALLILARANLLVAAEGRSENTSVGPILREAGLALNQCRVDGADA